MHDLYNKETGVKIANEPEELPPLRDEYVRLKHMTNFSQAQSLAENGLVYNGEYAKNFSRDNTEQKIHTHYNTIDSMAIAVDEEEFWNGLTSETGIRHRGSEAVAIFDMPAKEYSAHLNEGVSQFLSGTISAGYMVGIIPNYGTRDMNVFERLTPEETEKRKNQSLANQLPPKWETPHWQEDVAMAKNKLKQLNEETMQNGSSQENQVQTDNISMDEGEFTTVDAENMFESLFGGISENTTVQAFVSEHSDNADSEWDWDDGNDYAADNKDERQSNDSQIRSKALQKMLSREQNRNENTDYLQEKLNRLRQKLGVDDESKYKTAQEVTAVVGVESQTNENGVIRGKYKKGKRLNSNDYVGEIHIEAMLESMKARKSIDR